FDGGIASIGSIENTTNMKHGVVELFTFTKNLDVISYQNTASYVDTTAYNETNYLTGKAIDNRYDGEIGNPMVALLKEIPLNDTHWIDFLEINSNSLDLNYTYSIPKPHFEEISDFEIIDVDSDGKYELYVLGRNTTNPTNYSLAEYSYNSSAKIYDLTNTYIWNGTNQNLIEMDMIDEAANIYFITAGIDTVSLESFTQVISITRGITRSFSLTGLEYYSFGADTFRVYGMKLYDTGVVNSRGVALFGSYSVGVSDTYPFCLKIVDIVNPIIAPDFTSLNYNPSWSFDGLIVDIDYDGIDEIIQTTYDLVGTIKSDYVVMTSSGLTEVNSDTTDLYQIRSSASLGLPEFQISSWIGKNDLGNFAIEFYYPHHVSYRLFGNAEILIEDYDNQLYFVTTYLTGTVNPRSDLVLHAGLTFDPSIDEMLGSMPDYLNFSIGSIPFAYENEEILLNITKGS
ncbi:MAG: hypothetical protein KAQ95_12360, partial [Candidatus Heimdallarchaeota archaeon]|nr:hypothetical protein [Candidatus Heimdallarchaeota archaeon]